MAPQEGSGYTFGHPKAVVAWHAQRNCRDDAPYLLAHLRPDSRVLDVGCGPGSITASFVADGHIDPARGGAVVGVEPAPAAGKPDVLEQARRDAAERLRERGPQVQAGVTFEHADAYSLAQFPDASFDVVHTHQVLFHLADPPRAIRAALRVLKPGGILACREAVWQSQASYPDLSRWKDIMHRAYTSNGASDVGAVSVHAWLRRAAEEVEPRTTRDALVSRWTATPVVKSFSNAVDGHGGRDFAENVIQRLRIADWREEVRHKGIVPYDRTLDELVESLQRFAADPDAWMVMTNIDLLAWRK